MKQVNKKLFVSALFLIFFSFCFYISADIDGRTGRTLKTSTQGCGSCHGAGATTGVSVVINGPDTVNTGQGVTYSLTITRSGKTGAGLDVAVRRGSLTASSSNTHIASGELTHNDNLTMTAGTITIPFTYNSPVTAGLDTIFATGVATNSSGSSSGDEWNWALSKRVVIMMPSGIYNFSSMESYELKQNYPNPFNPSTVIKLSLNKPMNVTLRIYDLTGKLIEELHSGKLETGDYSFKWNADKSEKLSGGVYIYEASGDDFRIAKKMMYLK